MYRNPLYSVLHSIFAVNGHSVPSGLPLYRYRCSDEQYEQLKTLLSSHNQSMRQGRRAPLYVHEAFCLFCSEWVRRNHLTGHVKWSDITEALDWPNLSSSTLTYLTESGLKFWKRPLRTKGNKPAYLLTLVLEGGLPLKMVSTNEGTLVTYFRKVLTAIRQNTQQTVDVYELAASYEEFLPTSLRNDVVFNLAGEFCRTLNDLARQVDVSRSDVVCKIKANDKNWYKQLPVVLSEVDAEKLAKAVFASDSSSTSNVRSSLRIQREWIKEDDIWFCETTFKLPLQVKTKVLENHFNLNPNSKATRLVLACTYSDEAKTLALLSKHDEDIWSVEKYAAANDIISGRHSLSEFNFQLFDGGTELGAYVPVGGEALSGDLPWVLEPLDEDMTKLRLIGSGSLSAKSPSVFLAMPLSNSFITLDSDGDFGIPELIDNCERFLTQVRGDYIVTLEDGIRCNIKTGQVEDEVPHFVFGRTAFKNIFSKYPIFVGEPIIFQVMGAEYQRVNTESFVWRRLRPGQAEWIPCSERKPLGKVEIRQVVDGVVRYSSRCVILPENANVSLLPKSEVSGVVRFVGFKDAKLEDLHEGEFYESHSDFSENDIRLEVLSKSQYKQSLKLKISWPDVEPVELLIPFPAKGSRFVSFDKNLSDLVSVGHLFGMRAEGIEIDGQDEKYWVEAEKTLSDLQSPSNGANLLKIKFPMLGTGSEGTKELSLACMQRPVQSLLSAAEMDEVINLRAYSAGTKESTLSIGRYSLILSCHSSGISLTPESMQNLTDDVSVFAMNLSSLDQELIQLTFSEHGGVELYNLAGKQGAWLLYCERDGVVVSNQTIVNSNENESEESLVSRSMYKDDAATKFLVEDLSSFASVNWYELLKNLVAMGRFDAKMFSICNQLKSSNKQLINLLFISTFTGNYEQIYGLENQLGFSWGGIPLEDWEAAAEKLVLDTKNDPSMFVGMLAMMQIPLRTLAHRDWRIRAGVNIVLKRLSKEIGQSIELVENATEEQFNVAIQELIRLVDNLARIDGYGREIYISALRTEKTLAKAVDKCWFDRQYSIEVSNLLNHVMLSAAFTLLRADEAKKYIKLNTLFNLAYQQAPEHFGPIFNFFQNNLVK